jgi:hypothetical protein
MRLRKSGSLLQAASICVLTTAAAVTTILPLLLAGANVTPATPAPMALTPCHIDLLPEEVLCGLHEVFENRQEGTGRQIAIHVAVLPPLRRSAEPDPLFIFSGGPGQAPGGSVRLPLATSGRSGGHGRSCWSIFVGPVRQAL